MLKRKIIFVPGKNPKPEPKLHLSLLRQCLRAGLSNAGHPIFDQVNESFELCAWNYDFYHEYEDINTHLPWMDKMCSQQSASQADRDACDAYQRKFKRFLYLLADSNPWLIDLVADDKTKALLDGSSKYFNDIDGAASAARDKLKLLLNTSADKGEKVLLIAHSMGSVIAYDSLYQLMQENKGQNYTDLFITMGSPLGLKFTQRQLLSYDPENAESFPDNINHWQNISASGDLISTDTTLADDFSTMLESGRVESIEDFNEGVYNWFQNAEGYNPHRSYGYFVTSQLGQIIADWWKQYD